MRSVIPCGAALVVLGASGACGLALQGSGAVDAGPSTADGPQTPLPDASRDGRSDAGSDAPAPADGADRGDTGDGGLDVADHSDAYTDPGALCPDDANVCPFGKLCSFCIPSSAGSPSCGSVASCAGGTDTYHVSCDDSAECSDGGVCCVVSTTGHNIVITCASLPCPSGGGHPLCDPKAPVCPSGTCQPGDGPLMPTSFWNCR